MLLASDELKKLDAQRAAAGAMWTRNFEIAKDAYDRIDADVQALGACVMMRGVRLATRGQGWAWFHTRDVMT